MQDLQEKKPRNAFASLAAGLFRAVDLARRLFLNVLFLLVLLMLWTWVASDGIPRIPSSTALVLDPRGVIVEQLAGDPVDRAWQTLTGAEVPEALLRDLVEAVTAAKDDDRVEALYLDMSQLLGGALPKLRDLRTAIDEFRASGKPVIAAADFYSNARYYLAAGADEIYLHPMGAVMFEGYGVYRNYYREGLDRFGVDWNVFRVGQFKSAVEPYLRDSMSEEVKEVNLEWLGQLWNAYLADVAAARGIPAERLAEAIGGFNDHLAETGDAARAALDLGLVDRLAHPDEVRRRLIEIVGEDRDTHSFHGVGYRDFNAARGAFPAGDGEVAVVLAKGTILPGHQPPGQIGGQSTAELIREARYDDGVKAVVLRVDSGGGSAYASEVIRRELEQVREAGKPVVVSMGSYAASGGYWISTASDEIWASPDTVTGSIGIFGYFPTFQRPLARYLGVRVDGVGTTWLSGVRPDRELPEEMKTALQLLIEEGYRDFLERVADARGMTTEEVDGIGQGRVWTGHRAKEIGLVDQLGTLDDAVAAAARHAGLEEGYGVRYLEKELTFREQLLVTMMAKAGAFYRPASERRPSLPDTVGRLLLDEVDRLSEFQDPMGVYAHCLCQID